MVHILGFAVGILMIAQSVLAAPPSAGERLAAPCAGCHGTGGASPGTMTPVIGGQQADYLNKVMLGFADGSRPGSVMANFAKGYNAEQTAQLTTAIASWKWVNSPDSPKKSVRKPKNIEMCAPCHGSKGEGGPAGPRLAGQASTYLKDAMKYYREGKLTAAEMGMAKGLSDKEITALGDYYSKLR